MSANATTIVILAGGQGSRFWPMSRTKRPKQFLSIGEKEESLIQATARRVVPLSGKDNLLVVTNKLHEQLILEHVPYAQVLSEPVGKNTAASIGLAAIKLAKTNPETVMVVLPADHAVKDEAALLGVYQEAIDIARSRDLLVSIGISPTSPHTGYGYIKKGKVITGRTHEIGRFFEKPNYERAVQYFESGEYLWNAGMFVWRASVILEAFKEFMPQLYEGLRKIDAVLGTPTEQKIIAEVFDGLENVSIDFGILEHVRNGACVAAPNFGWSDVGSWDAWAENFETDSRGNLLYGDALVLDGTNNVVHSKQRFIAMLGLTNMVVIDSGDAILICPREKVQDVKKIVEELKKSKRDELI